MRPALEDDSLSQREGAAPRLHRRSLGGTALRSLMRRTKRMRDASRPDPAPVYRGLDHSSHAGHPRVQSVKRIAFFTHSTPT